MMLGEILGAPEEQAYAPQPPKTPEELQQNRGLWDNFKMQMQDPNFRTSLLLTGINLMRNPGYGQNGWDVAANALQTGVGTLQGLRSADRERKDKLTQQTVENDRAAKTTQAYVDATGAQVRSTDANIGFKGRELTEAERANAEREKIERERIAAGIKEAGIRASAGSGGASGPRDLSRQPAVVQQIENLAAMLKSQGIPEVEARGQATIMINELGKGKAPAEIATQVYLNMRQAYEASFAGMDKPITPEIDNQIFQAAQARVNSLLQMNTVGGRTPSVSGYLDQGTPTPEAAQPKPAIVAKVQALTAAKVPPAAIRQALINEGENPQLYGY